MQPWDHPTPDPGWLADENGKVLAQIDGCKALFSAGSLYCDYLRCLEALLAAPEPGAPAFMSSKAWQIKSCQTALSGWAQLRHTWTLQAKQTVEYLGLTLRLLPDSWSRRRSFSPASPA